MKKKAEDLLSGSGFDDKYKDADHLDDQEKLALSIKQTLLESKKENLTSIEKVAIWSAITDETLTEQNNKKSRSIWWKSLAAIAIIVLGAVFVFNSYNQESSLEQAAISNKTYLAKSDEVQLLNADKKSFSLHADSTLNYQKFKNSETTLSTPSVQEARYSSVSVPYGKRSEILLEDGTKVWLNAGSILTFPDNFNKNAREVYLEGEGYFEVAPNANNPFFVRSEYLNIEVLGTSFNISAYTDDSFVSAVLLTGSVAIKANGKSNFERQVLKVGMEAKIDKRLKKMTLNQTSTQESISWTKKRLLLNETDLFQLIRKLERFYNTKIEDASGMPPTETFSGSLDLTQTLTQVLQHIYNEPTYSIEQVERRVYIHRK